MIFVKIIKQRCFILHEFYFINLFTFYFFCEVTETCLNSYDFFTSIIDKDPENRQK